MSYLHDIWYEEQTKLMGEGISWRLLLLHRFILFYFSYIKGISFVAK